MTLFYVIIAAVIALAIFIRTDQKQGSKIYLGIVFSFLAAMMMLRASTVGNDTSVYIKAFNDIVETNDLKFYIENSVFEKGFIYLNLLLSKISAQPQIIFIVTGAFVAFSFARFFYKYSEYPFMSVFMFLTLQFFDLSMSGVRQVFSISILLFSYELIQKRLWWRFLFLVLIAMSIHTSAVAFLLLYPISKIKPTRFFFIFSGALGIAGTICFPLILRLLQSVVPQYVKYFEEDGKSFKTSPTLACALMLSLFLVLLIISTVIRKSIPTESELIQNNSEGGSYVASTDNIMVISIWLGILMLLLSMNGTILNRFKYILSAPILVYYPNSVLRIKDQATRMFVTMMSCVVFFLYIYIIYTLRPEWQSTYPYTFFWQEEL